MTLAIHFNRLPSAGDLPLPSRATSGAAGIDLAASRDVAIRTGEWQAVPTGFAVEIPDGYEGQIRPRSGWAAKFGLTVLNAPGTIDSDYRGEVQVLLINFGRPIQIKRGDRIAQMVVAPVAILPIIETTDISVTERGEGGLGSTGR